MIHFVYVSSSKNSKKIGFFSHPFLNILCSALDNAGFFFTLRET